MNMMQTNDERREVAARLRALDARKLSCYGQEFDALMIASLMTACGCNFGQGWQDMELCDRLAELIEPEPERTCRFRNDGHGILWCDAEGCDYEMDDYSPIPNYCPNCNAKVVE